MGFATGLLLLIQKRFTIFFMKDCFERQNFLARLLHVRSRPRQTLASPRFCISNRSLRFFSIQLIWNLFLGVNSRSFTNIVIIMIPSASFFLYRHGSLSDFLKPSPLRKTKWIFLFQHLATCFVPNNDFSSLHTRSRSSASSWSFTPRSWSSLSSISYPFCYFDIEVFEDVSIE